MKNADRVMESMRAEAYRKAVCAPCMTSYDVSGTMLPEKLMQKCDAKSCSVYGNDPNGLGMGRSYGTGSTGEGRQKFVQEKAKEAEYFKKNANCCALPRDDLNYYPIDPDMVHKNGTGRLTIPYGGFAMAGGDPTIKHMHIGMQ